VVESVPYIKADSNTVRLFLGGRTLVDFPLRPDFIRQSDEMAVREDAISTSAHRLEDLTHLPDPQYRLARPIEVVIIPDGACLIATENTYLRYGVGRTAKEAKEDYARSLLDYYEDLVRFDGRLSAQLQEDLNTLHTLIVVQEGE
jgi:hypothetical protein